MFNWISKIILSIAVTLGISSPAVSPAPTPNTVPISSIVVPTSTPPPTPIIITNTSVVTICHHPSEKNSKPQTITINASAMNVHLTHGDTVGSCPGAPLAPDNFKAVAVKNQVNLSWEDNSDNESKLKISRRLMGGAWVLIKTTATNTTSYTDSGLTNGVYEYDVMACNSSGCSAYSDVATITISDQAVSSGRLVSSPVPTPRITIIPTPRPTAAPSATPNISASPRPVQSTPLPWPQVNAVDLSAKCGGSFTELFPPSSSQGEFKYYFQRKEDPYLELQIYVTVLDLRPGMRKFDWQTASFQFSSETKREPPYVITAQNFAGDQSALIPDAGVGAKAVARKGDYFVKIEEMQRACQAPGCTVLPTCASGFPNLAQTIVTRISGGTVTMPTTTPTPTPALTPFPSPSSVTSSPSSFTPNDLGGVWELVFPTGPGREAIMFHGDKICLDVGIVAYSEYVTSPCYPSWASYVLSDNTLKFVWNGSSLEWKITKNTAGNLEITGSGKVGGYNTTYKKITIAPNLYGL